MSQRDAPGEQGMTVGAAARATGVTVRTLHHWDDIGLLTPSSRTPAGYRLYIQPDIDRILRIVAYQRAGLGLEDIRDLLQRPSDQIIPALDQQRRLLTQRIDELTDLDNQLERISTAHREGILLTPDEQTALFGDDWNPHHANDARQQWGSTLQWAQFAERSATRSATQWAELAQRMHALEDRFAAAIDSNLPPDSPTASDLVECHRHVFSELFPITRQMHVCLGRLFANNPDFRRHYDTLRPGLATWLHHAINHNVAAHGINPDQATWQ
ncbi:MerR family transcriptional regulator [Luteococcus sp. H138]|uniref:MerR family transcriptional regulator n=1 Tax=unclassified Luteococcus TaxID=2639923 RepID=UPI00313ECB7D